MTETIWVCGIMYESARFIR